MAAASVPPLDIAGNLGSLTAGAGSWKAPSRDGGRQSIPGNNSGQGEQDGRAKLPPASVLGASALAPNLLPGPGQKLSLGAGQSPAETRDSRGSTSLDEIQTNRDSVTPAGWRKWCGSFSTVGRSTTNPGKSRFCRVGCKCWNCAGCGPRRASMYRVRIIKTAQKLGLNKLLTLTLDPAKLAGVEDTTKYINEVFADFRQYLRRKCGGRAPSYIRVLEYQKNGNAHLHILVSAYLSQEWVAEAWGALGGGHIVDIRRVDMHRVSHYLSKYLTKAMIEHAPPRARRVTTSRDIKLLERHGSEYEWSMMRAPINCVLAHYREKVTTFTADAEGNLWSFEIFEGDTGPPATPGPAPQP